MDRAYIHTLPFELLDYIFELCGCTIALGDKLPFAFTISLVCVRWRHHMLHSPKFWSSFEIAEAKSPAVMQSQLELCLARSRGSFYSISFDSIFITPKLDSVSKSILSQVGRWKNVSIPASLYSGTVATVGAQPLLYLERLRVTGGEGCAFELFAPNLTHLGFYNSVYSVIPPALQLEKLSYLQLHHCTFTMMDFACLIHSPQNIRTMELICVELTGTYTGSHPDKICLANLSGLTLAMSYSDTSLVLDSIIAPRLDTLGLYSLTSRPNSHPSQSVTTFVHESKFALRELTLCSFPLAAFLLNTDALRSVKVLRLGQTMRLGGEEMIVRLLKPIPGLESFSLWYDQEYDDTLFGGLVPFIEGNRQNIQQVSLKNVETKDLDMEVLMSCNLPSESWWM